MSDLSKYREQLAEALAEHVSEQLWKPGGWAGDTACSCGWRMAMWSRKDFPETHRKHVADALLASPVLAQMLAEAKAEALRDAANAWTRGGWSDVMLPKPAPPAAPVIAYSNRVGDRLRDRAEASDQEGEQ